MRQPHFNMSKLDSIKKYSPKIQQIFSFVFLELFTLFFFFFLKYHINQYSIYNFNPYYFGNFIIGIISIINILLILVISIRYPRSDKKSTGILHRFILIKCSALLIVFLLALLGIRDTEMMWGTFSLNKFAPVLFFFIYVVLSLYQMVVAVFLGLNNKINFQKTLYSFLVLVFVFFIFTFLKVSTSVDQTKSIKADFGIIMGAAVYRNNLPSPLFEGRIKKGLELYKSKKVKKLQVTGNNAPGEISEALSASNYLRKYGVHQSSILIEDNSRTTADQLKFIESEFGGNGAKLVIISDEFHSQRIYEMAKFYRLDISCVNSDYELKTAKLLYYRLREAIALILFWLFAM